MSKTRKITTAIGIGVVVAAIAATQVPISSAWMFRFMSWQIKRGRVRIFCKTDHEALLKACREFSKRAGVGKHESRVYEMGIFSGLSLPRPIRALRPREVMVCNDGTVHISMYSGWHPFGVWACPEGYGGRSRTTRAANCWTVCGIMMKTISITPTTWTNGLTHR